MSSAGAPSVSASAPGCLELAGGGDGPRLSVALDRRASCRVEAIPAGVELESKESLTKASARDVGALVERDPRSLAAQVLAALGASSGYRVVTEWKVPAGAGIEGGAALALATTAAVSRALGRDDAPGRLVALAREAAARAGRADEHHLHAALFGGVVLTRVSGGVLEAERPAVDPGRVDESLLVVDGGAPEAVSGAPSLRPGSSAEASRTGPIVEALRSGHYEEVVHLLAEEPGAAVAGPGQRRIVELVRGAGGAARPLGAGRLVAVWAPPGSRGPGRREAVLVALRAAGLKPVAVRVDLRGLELD